MTAIILTETMHTFSFLFLPKHVSVKPCGPDCFNGFTVPLEHWWLAGALSRALCADIQCLSSHFGASQACLLKSQLSLSSTLCFSQRDGLEYAASNTCTYLGPGCVPSLVLQSTAGCIHSRVCSCQWDTSALAQTGCASPAGSPCSRCGPACLAARGYRGGRADLRKIEEKK